MKKKILIVILFFHVFFSCGLLLNYKKTYIKAVIEKDYSFFKLGYPIKYNQFPDSTENTYYDFIYQKIDKWNLPNKFERDTSNMVMIHNTLKAIGYKNFINDSEYNREMNFFNEKCSFKCKLDSFIISYTQNLDTSNYYYKFWERRKNENNAKTLNRILTEIQLIYNGKRQKETEVVNDTLANLLKYDLIYQKSLYKDTSKYVLEYFNYLKSIKLEVSAFNLIFHTDKFKYLDLNRDSLLKTIQHDTIKWDEWSNLYEFEGQGKWVFEKKYWGP